MPRCTSAEANLFSWRVAPVDEAEAEVAMSRPPRLRFVFFFMVVIFTYFYTAITVIPKQMADDMKKNGGFIPGIKPGRATADYLDNVMSRITFPGSLFLGIVAILPAFAMQGGVNIQFAQFYGGTSLLILVGVILDTLQQIESHLLMRHYDGLMKTGRIKGKSSGSMM